MNAYAMIVDINGFTVMVQKSPEMVAQFVRDILTGGVSSVEKAGGSVVGFMGDAFLAIFPESSKIVTACFAIAKDCDRQAEYITSTNLENPEFFPLKKGPSLKIGIEFGHIDTSTISSKALGEQQLHIGIPINYASRILADGEGNRCHLGPVAAQRFKADGFTDLRGPHKIFGKHKGEKAYKYFQFEMDDIWKEGRISKRDESYLG